VNLATLAVGSTVSLPTRPLQQTYIRPNGVGLLLGGARLASDATVIVGAGPPEESFAGRSERAGDTRLVVFNGLTLGSMVELAIPQTVRPATATSP